MREGINKARNRVNVLFVAMISNITRCCCAEQNSQYRETEQILCVTSHLANVIIET